MTANELSALAGIVLSLAFSYIPKANTWFAALAAEYKRLIMLGVLLATALAVYGISCAGWFATGITCDQAGITALVQAFIAALVANQATYLITPQPSAVREARLESREVALVPQVKE